MCYGEVCIFEIARYLDSSIICLTCLQPGYLKVTVAWWQLIYYYYYYYSTHALGTCMLVC